MYDGLQSPGRNDECWCGSGKKYKKCHLDFDERLEELAETGEEVPPRDLLKTPAEIEGIKRSAEVNVGVLDYVAERIAPGITTEQIDQWVHDYTVEHGAIPAPLDYEGFPKSVCTSVNEVVCHGIPSPDEVLREGDIVNIDCSTIKDGFFSDSSRMFCIGDVSPEKKRLVEIARQSLEVGLKEVKPWNFLGDMGSAIHDFVRENGYSVVREIGGHGIGLEFHEEPWVSYVSEKGTEMLMVPGMMFTIEPMINMGKPDVFVDEDDDWTVYTEDGLPSAQWEIQVLVTEDGYEIIQDFLASYDHPNGSKTPNRLKQEIERGKNSPYTRDLIASFPDFRFPVWAFQEVISFGSFNYFTKFCSERFEDKTLANDFYLLQDVRSLRNACAHNNCIINDMGAKPGGKRPNDTISQAVSSVASIGSGQRRSKLSNERLRQIVATLYLHKERASSGVLEHRTEDLGKFAERMKKNIDYYDGNNQIKSGFRFIGSLIESWYPTAQNDTQTQAQS